MQSYLSNLESTKMDLQSKLSTSVKKDTPTFKLKTTQPTYKLPTQEKETLRSTSSQIPLKDIPEEKKKPANLFQDEQGLVDKMLERGLTQERAMQVIGTKRNKMLGQVTQQEAKTLRRMMDDGLNSEKAVEIVREMRYDNLPLYKKALKVPFDASVGGLGMVAEQVGNVGGFLGNEEMQETGRNLRDIGERTTGDSKAAKFGEIVVGTGEALAVGPTSASKTLAGRTAQGAAFGGITGGGMKILGEGSDTSIGEVAKETAIGAAIGAAASPVIEKIAIPGAVAGFRGVKNLPNQFKKTTGKISESTQGLASGLSKEQIKGYKSNPYQSEEFDKLIQKSDSPEGIDDIKNYKTERISAVTDELTSKIDEIRLKKGETSKEYASIRKLETPVNADKIQSNIEAVLKKNGVEVVDGNLTRTAGIKSGVLNDADVAKFNQLYKDLIADKTRQGGTITPSQALDFRKTASELAKYDASTTSEGQRLMAIVRKEIDKVAKDEIPGLRKLDSQFVDKLGEFENAIKDLVYKGGDVKGEWRSNIVNIIGTLDRQNRNKLLGRLEEVMPGVKERVEAINNIPSIYKSMNDSKLADGLLSTGGALIGSATGPLGLVVGYIAGKGLNKAVTAGRRKAIEKILSSTSDEGKKKLQQINTKIAKKEELSKLDKDFINTFKKDVDKNIKTNQKKDDKLSPKPNSINNTNNNNISSSNVNLGAGSRSSSSNIQADIKKPATKNLAPSKKPLEKTTKNKIDDSFLGDENSRIDFVNKEIKELPTRIENWKKLYKETGNVKYSSFINKGEKVLEKYRQELSSNIKKPLSKLNSKNIYNTANTIAKQLGVPVKKVQEILKKYIDKYGDDIKNYLGDLADEIADKTGARSKFIDNKGKSLDDFGDNVIDTVNPTGTLFIEYTPNKRANATLDSNKLTTLSDTMGVNPNKEITIYRGAPKTQKNIVDGDFVTTSKDLAKAYAGEGKVLEMRVKAEDVLDEISEPLGDEYLYISAGKQKWEAIPKKIEKPNSKGIMKAIETINIELVRKNPKIIQQLKDEGFSGIENSRGRIIF